MVFLTAGLVVVALAVAVDLILTVGVVRRLRQHTAMLAASGRTPAPEPPKVGDSIRPFTATATDGQIVSREALPQGGLVVFLSPGCQPCEEQLPGLAAALRESGRPRGTTLVVLIADPAEATHMISALETLAVVVCETPPATQLQEAFGVWSAPLALIVEDSTIKELSMDTAKLAAARQPSAAVIG